MATSSPSKLTASGLCAALATGVLGFLVIPSAVADTDESARGYRYKSVDMPSQDAQQSGASAACPTGEPLIGGGVSSSGSFDHSMRVNTSRPFDSDDPGTDDDNLWSSFVDNVFSDHLLLDSITAFAICDKKGRASDYSYVRASVPAPDGVQTGTQAKCPKGEPVVGGGVRSSGFLADQMWVNTDRPWDSADRDQLEDDGWSAFVDNQTGGDPGQTITVYAICDRSRTTSDYRYKQRTAAAPEGAQASVAMACPDDERGVGGGVLSSGGVIERMYVNSSFPIDDDDAGLGQDDGWQATVDNRAGGTTRELITAFAICRR